MNVRTLLQELHSLDIHLSLDGDTLCCNAPAGGLTPTVREQLHSYRDQIIDFLRSADALSRLPPAIVPLQPDGERPPVFAVPGHNGDVFCFRELARELGDDQPFFGLQPPGVDGSQAPLKSVDALVDYYLPQILAFCPGRRYIIAGYCAGGAIAVELARQLGWQGAEIEFVVLLGCPYPSFYHWRSRPRQVFSELVARVRKHAAVFAAQPSWRGFLAYVVDKWRGRRQRLDDEAVAAADPVMVRRAKIEAATLTAVRHYKPQPLAGRLCLFQPNPTWRHAAGGVGWPLSAATCCEEYSGPPACEGATMLRPPYVAHFAEHFRRCREPLLAKALTHAPTNSATGDTLPASSDKPATTANKPMLVT